MQFQTSELVYLIPAIFIALSIHEAMHAFVAHALGDTTASDMGRLTLNPLKHIDLFTTILLPIVSIILIGQPVLAAKPVPLNTSRIKFDEFGVALVGLAGPITNLALAAISALVLRTIAMPNFLTEFTFIFAAINVGYFIFNMIPIPPLDGSRLLYAFAPEPLQKIMYRIESAGFIVILAILLILLPVIDPLISYLSNHILHLLLGAIYPI
jgi:Zn-dependent protease